MLMTDVGSFEVRGLSMVLVGMCIGSVVRFRDQRIYLKTDLTYYSLKCGCDKS